MDENVICTGCFSAAGDEWMNGWVNRDLNPERDGTESGHFHDIPLDD